jgi:23S rRNA (adenine2030-N6)-methyltransferase
MNYRHHFHAGNFADVVKHVLLLGLLDGLRRKDTPFCYIDTHAGVGIYDLGASAAQRTLEFKSGLGRLKSTTATNPPAWVADYQKAVAALQAERAGFWYPGSPWLALHHLRPQDRAVLMELHPEDAGLLKQYFSRHAQVAVHQRDAYEGLVALVPPKEKRGLVLIDPPYEEERDDYSPVVELLAKAHARWPTGMFALWFPIKDHQVIKRFYRRLRNSGIAKMLTTELCVLPPDNSLGLNGSGLVVVNPPWQFDSRALSTLQWLLPVLSDHPQKEYRVEWLAGEAPAASAASDES